MLGSDPYGFCRGRGGCESDPALKETWRGASPCASLYVVDAPTSAWTLRKDGSLVQAAKDGKLAAWGKFAVFFPAGRCVPKMLVVDFR